MNSRAAFDICLEWLAARIDMDGNYDDTVSLPKKSAESLFSGTDYRFSIEHIDIEQDKRKNPVYLLLVIERKKTWI